MLWEPTDLTKIRLIADYSYSEGDEGLNATMIPGAVGILGATFSGRYTTTNSPSDYGDNTQYGFSARVDQDLGSLQLVSISAYRANDQYFHIDVDSSTPVFLRSDLTGRNRTFSQELQLHGPTDGKLNWLIGAYYFNSSAGLRPLTFTGITQTPVGGRKDTIDTVHLDSYSGFVDGSYELFPDTKLTLGLRYTTDRLKNDVLILDAAGNAILTTPFVQKDTFSKLTYRAILDHHFTEDVLGYASYSRGFKSGGYNLTNPIRTIGGVTTPAPPVAPEIIDAFEVGLKTEWFDNRLRANISAFYYNYKNLQVASVGNGTSTIINGANAHIKGVDVDFEASPVARIRLNGGLSFLDSEFSSFANGPFTVPNPATCGTNPQTTGPLTGGNTTCSLDLTAFRTPRAPKFTGSLSATYDLPTEIGDFALTGSVYHNSGFAWEADNRLKQAAYTLLNATLGWASSDGEFSASLWAKNLGNSYYYTYVSAATPRDAGPPAPPRTYGMNLGVHF